MELSDALSTLDQFDLEIGCDLPVDLSVYGGWPPLHPRPRRVACFGGARGDCVVVTVLLWEDGDGALWARDDFGGLGPERIRSTADLMRWVSLTVPAGEMLLEHSITAHD